MKFSCLFGYHDFGPAKNIREQDMGAAWLFAPLVILFAFCGVPKECDRTCYHCGKTKTFKYPLQ